MMSKAPEKFDCVAWKRQAQRKLQEEYERRKSEFDSYYDFLKARVTEDPWSRKAWERIRRTARTS
jgi:hypothetical protein